MRSKSPILGDLTKSTVKKALKAAQKHRKDLLSLWNKYHSEQWIAALRTMKVSTQTQMDMAIDAAISQWNAEKDYRVFPTSIVYSATSGLATLTFENGASYQFNPLHIQEVTLETSKPTAAQLADVVIRAGGGSLHWPQLEASIGIDNLLLGRYGTDKWMMQLKALAA